MCLLAPGSIGVENISKFIHASVSTFTHLFYNVHRCLSAGIHGEYQEYRSESVLLVLIMSTFKDGDRVSVFKGSELNGV